MTRETGSGRWLRRLPTMLLAAVAIMAGPALVVLAASDRGTSIGGLALVDGIYRVPFGVFFAGTLAYGLLLRKAGILRDIGGALAAEGAMIATIVALGFLAFPVLFGLGEGMSRHGFYWQFAILTGIALAGAVAFRLFLGSGVSGRVEIPALLTSALLVHMPLVQTWGGSGVRSSVPMERLGALHLYGAWPVLLGLLPLVALVLWSRPALSVRRVVATGLLALAVPFVLKVAIDAAAGRASPMLWPARVVLEYRSPDEATALIRTLTSIHGDGPNRIGDHWYKFRDNIGANNPRVNRAGLPDRMIELQILVPAEDLGLPPPTQPFFKGRITLNLSVSDWPKSGVKAHFEDLTITVRRGDDWPSDDTVRTKIRDYVAAARVPGPAD